MSSTNQESQIETGQAERKKGGVRLRLAAIAMLGLLNLSPIFAQSGGLEIPNSEGTRPPITEPSNSFSLSQQIENPHLQKGEKSEGSENLVRGQTLPIGGPNIKIREVDRGLVDQIFKTLDKQEDYKGAKIIVGQDGRALNMLSFNTITGALEFTYPHAPKNFIWDGENQVWFRQVAGETVVYIPSIALPGAWDNEKGEAGPAAIPEAAVLVQTPEGNFQMAVVYDQSSIEGYALENPPIAIKGTDQVMLMGAFKNIELKEGQRLENIVDPQTNHIIGYKIVNQDGSYFVMLTSWDGVEKPEDVANLFKAKGIVDVNGKEIPFPPEDIVSPDKLADPNVQIEQGGDIVRLETKTEETITLLEVTRAGSRVRQLPDTKSNVITTLPAGSQIQYIGPVEGEAVNGNSGWYKIKIEGDTYYIHSSLVDEKQGTTITEYVLGVALTIDGNARWFSSQEELDAYLKKQGLVLVGDRVIQDPRDNLELFDIKKRNSPIPQFVNTMKMAGLEISPQDVVNNLDLKPIEGPNGEPIVIASYTTIDSQNTPYTVAFIAMRQENGWGWASINKSLRKLIESSNLIIGSQIVHYKLDNSNYTDIARGNFNLFLSDGELHEPSLWILGEDENGNKVYDYNYERIDRIINFGRNERISTFAFNHLVEPSPDGNINQGIILFDNVPQQFNSLSNEEKRTLMNQRIENTLTHIRNMTTQDTTLIYSVVNENFNWTQPRIPFEWVTEFYRTARKTDPNAILLYNDVNVFLDGNIDDHDRAVLSLATSLKSQGLLDGVGLQMHLDINNIPSDDVIKKLINLYKTAGLKVYITEFDIDFSNFSGSEIQKQQLKAYIYQRIIRVAMNEAVDGFIMFGFTADAAWHPDSMLFNNNYAPTPAFYSFISELLNFSNK
jgi:GH35 family endo-1,4-beta-xylanase